MMLTPTSDRRGLNARYSASITAALASEPAAENSTI